MKDLMTRAWVYMDTQKYILKNRMQNFKKEFENDERGVGAMVATIIIMLIVVLLAAVFWDSINNWFDEIMGKIFGEGTKNAGTGFETKYEGYQGS